MTTLTPSEICFSGAGRPSIASRFKQEPAPHNTLCSTCGAAIQPGAESVPISSFDNKAFSNHHESFRFGGAYVCLSCAWLYGAGPSKPGNFVATPDAFTQTVISLESVVADKAPWLHTLRKMASLPPDTPVTGVLTTDVKIRLWPRILPATIGNFGLYVHSPDHDFSQFVYFDLSACLDLIESMIPMLKEGFAKASLWYGLSRDFHRFSRNPARSLEWESYLQKHRHLPEFLPAVLIAGVTKEEKKSEPSKRTAGDTPAASAASHHPAQDQLGLF